MIQIEIINSLDNDAINIYEYFLDELTIGKSASDIIIFDETLKKCHLKLFIKNDQLFGIVSKNEGANKLNYKKVTGQFSLNIGDIISIEKNDIKILSFKNEVIPDYKQLIKNKIDELTEREDPIIDLLKNLRKEI